MSNRLLSWTDEAWNSYVYWQTQDKKTLKRINKLISDVKRSPFDGIGKPEPLKENLSGFWSRRIDDTTVWYIPWTIPQLQLSRVVTITNRWRLTIN